VLHPYVYKSNDIFSNSFGSMFSRKSVYVLPFKDSLKKCDPIM